MEKENKKEQSLPSIGATLDATSLLLEWSDLKDRIREVEDQLQAFSDLVKGNPLHEREVEKHGNDYIN